MPRATPSVGRFALAVLCVLVVSLVGCSEKSKTLAEVRQAISQKNYEEALILCQHALRKNIRDGEVYYYYGLALLELGRDYESFRQFEDAVAADSTLSTRVAGQLLRKGQQARDAGETKRAADRLRRAVEFNPDVGLGVLSYLVADAYFADKNFSSAAALYETAVKAHADTAAAEGAYFNLAECYAALSDSARAMEVLEEQLKRFPKGALAGRAKWKLVNILYESARHQFALGNYEAVVDQVTELLDQTNNNSLVQRARFLLGEAYERMGEYRKAYEQYKAIIDKDRGASGRIVERAREKINAFRDSGLL